MQRIGAHFGVYMSLELCKNIQKQQKNKKWANSASLLRNLQKKIFFSIPSLSLFIVIVNGCQQKSI